MLCVHSCPIQSHPVHPTSCPITSHSMHVSSSSVPSHSIHPVPLYPSVSHLPCPIPSLPALAQPWHTLGGEAGDTERRAGQETLFGLWEKGEDQWDGSPGLGGGQGCDSRWGPPIKDPLSRPLLGCPGGPQPLSRADPLGGDTRSSSGMEGVPCQGFVHPSAEALWRWVWITRSAYSQGWTEQDRDTAMSRERCVPVTSRVCTPRAPVCDHRGTLVCPHGVSVCSGRCSALPLAAPTLLSLDPTGCSFPELFSLSLFLPTISSISMPMWGSPIPQSGSRVWRIHWGHSEPWGIHWGHSEHWRVHWGHSEPWVGMAEGPWHSLVSVDPKCHIPMVALT
ncbi:uncharacterized protein LOC128812923 [Vidua macroura]|uniref:uncharacterized protein LOC128812923 n=1 Tax=Vidua macroura TaxID=187451 RepID=UPI0023A8FD58|nr:uncharacterized protein LOC128812923 [Vidua macroura]